MMPRMEIAQRRIGALLVALQFGFIAVLGLLVLPAVRARAVSPGAWSLALAGLALGVWALSANRPGNFNIRPAPRADGQLVRTGPYRWIRHPMYTAVLACGAACAWAAGSWVGWSNWLALTVVLLVKALIEERWITRAHPDYADYAAHSRRFLPGLF